MDKIVVPIEKFDKIHQIAKNSEVKELSFEYIVGSCFPDALANIKNRITTAYTQGYLDGLKDKKEVQE